MSCYACSGSGLYVQHNYFQQRDYFRTCLVCNGSGKQMEYPNATPIEKHIIGILLLVVTIITVPLMLIYS